MKEQPILWLVSPEEIASVIAMPHVDLTADDVIIRDYPICDVKMKDVDIPMVDWSLGSGVQCISYIIKGAEG